MKYIFLVLIFALELFGAVVKSPIVNVNADESEATIKIEKIDIGISGFIVHEISDGHKMILKNAVVVDFNEESKIATIRLSQYDGLQNSALPSGRWKVQIGDMLVLAFGYTRGLLIAPSEEIYYRVTKNSKLQWIHPDIFATILSFNGHPTPLRKDFTDISVNSSVGLIYIFLDNIIYTLDAKSFKILTTTEAKFTQDETKLPFYTRVPKIDANWWGEGSDKLKDYEPHYYKLIAEANPLNRELYERVRNGDKKLQYILKEFDIKD